MKWVFIILVILITITVLRTPARVPAPAVSVQEEPSLIPETLTHTLVSVQEQTSRYKIEGTYPFFAGYDQINTDLSSRVQQGVTEFKKEALALDEPSIRTFRTTVFDPVEEIISIVFEERGYMGAAARDYFYTAVYRYNVRTQQFVTLTDMGISLEALSAASIPLLEKKLGSAFDRTGAAPLEAHYQEWRPTPEGILVYFNPYQVGNRAEVVSIVIPWNVVQ